MKIAAAQTVAAIERLDRADRRHAAIVEQWDADLFLLNTPGGTVDLRTGECHGHDREQYLTKMTAASPGGDCSLWRCFLDRVTDGNSRIAGVLAACHRVLFDWFDLRARSVLPLWHRSQP